MSLDTAIKTSLYSTERRDYKNRCPLHAKWQELNGSTEFRRKHLRKQKEIHDETSNYSEDEDLEVYFRCGVFDVIIDPGTYSDRFKHMGLVSDRFNQYRNHEKRRTGGICTYNKWYLKRHHSGDLPCEPKSRSAQTSIDEEEHLDKVFPHSTVALSVFLTMPLTAEDPLASWNSIKRTFVQQWTTIAWPTCQASPLKTAKQGVSKCCGQSDTREKKQRGIFLNLSWRAVNNYIKQMHLKWALLYTIMH